MHDGIAAETPDLRLERVREAGQDGGPGPGRGQLHPRSRVSPASSRHVMRRPLVAVLLLAGCAASGALRRDALVGSTWAEICPSPGIATAFVRLDADGHLAWSYDHPDSLIVEPVHTWAVEDGELQLRWNQGSATSRYRAGADPDDLLGKAFFCRDGPSLRRLRPAG